MYTSDTIDTEMLSPPLQPLPNNNLIEDDKEDEIEIFECQKCSEYNFIKKKKKARRVTKVRHVRVNSVTWASLRRYATLNNVSMDYALMMLLYNSRTSNVNYLLNSKSLASNSSTRVPKLK